MSMGHPPHSPCSFAVAHILGGENTSHTSYVGWSLTRIPRLGFLFSRLRPPALAETPRMPEHLGVGVSACNGRNTPSHASPSFFKRLKGRVKFFNPLLDDLNAFRHGVAETLRVARGAGTRSLPDQLGMAVIATTSLFENLGQARMVGKNRGRFVCWSHGMVVTRHNTIHELMKVVLVTPSQYIIVATSFKLQALDG